MDITCMKNPRENKDIRTIGQVLFQEQKGTYVLMFFCLFLPKAIVKSPIFGRFSSIL